MPPESGDPGDDDPGRHHHHRHADDDWIMCSQGHQHWGLNGAAGLLLARRARDGALQVVLQHRALWSHQGGTWGFPGGALAPGESAQDGALREAAEEAGIEAVAVRVLSTPPHVLLDHGNWTYTTVLGEALSEFTPAATDSESLEVRWVPFDEVLSLPLLPAFEDAWPKLREFLEGVRL